ncbi:MAG: hypothetical protein ASARMPRED_000894 [Alectoria sarmentosa]|nr:MAG: hypothetical protein ASARMPRED_000894 [Alectoria sarmentosa]
MWSLLTIGLFAAVGSATPVFPGQNMAVKRSATSQTSITVGNSTTSQILIGDISGDTLKTGLLNALTPLCGDFGCSGSSASIPNIDYSLGGNEGVQTGTLNIAIVDSHYTGTAMSNAMIQLMVAAMVQSATGKNCGPVSYTQGCTSKSKRVVGPSGSDCQTHSINVCSAASKFGVQIVDPSENNAILGFMDFTATFAGSTTPFNCQDFIGLIQGAIGPFSATFTTILGDISAGCGDVAELAGSTGN